MVIEIIFLLICFYLYFLFYTNIKINKNNEFYLYEDELTRKNINNEINLKLPFYFNGKHLNEKINKSNLIIKDKDKKIYTKSYETIKILEPYIKFDVENMVYYLDKKQNINVHINITNNNFYFIKKGKCKVCLIHPKYKDNFYKNNEISCDNKKIKYIKENDNFKVLECYENTIIYIPNYWLVYIENTDSKQTIIETIKYKTLINKLLFFYEKVFNKKSSTLNNA